MSFIQKIIEKLAVFFKRDAEHTTEQGNILIEHQRENPARHFPQPTCVVPIHRDIAPVEHHQKLYLRIEHLAEHARKRRVRKKNRHRLSKYESQENRR